MLSEGCTKLERVEWKKQNQKCRSHTQYALTEVMKSQQLKNLTGIVSDNQIWENTSLWPDSVQQWFFCIPSSKFVTLTKFSTGTQNGIYSSRNISPFECG